MCKPCVGAKVVLRFQALIAHAFLDRSITFLYHTSACTSGLICRKRILFISRFGVIVSHFVRGDIFFDSPCTCVILIDLNIKQAYCFQIVYMHYMTTDNELRKFWPKSDNSNGFWQPFYNRNAYF